MRELIGRMVTSLTYLVALYQLYEIFIVKDEKVTVQ